MSYLYGKFKVNENGYLDFIDKEHFGFRIKDVPNCFEVEYCIDEDGNKWDVGFLYYDFNHHTYNVHETCDPSSAYDLLDYDKLYRVKKQLYFMLDSCREICRAKDVIFYANGSYLLFMRKVVK